MQEIINISQNRIGDNTVNSVSARELHTRLEVKKDYSDWIKVQVKRGMFDKHIDYIVLWSDPLKGVAILSETELLKKFKSVQQATASGWQSDYILTLDTAKHIALMSETQKGKEVRNYFVEIEARYSQQLEKQEEKRISPKDIQELNQYLSEFIKMAHLCEFKGNQAILSADKGVRNITGHSPLKLLDEIHLVANEKTKIFTPTQLGKEIGKTAMEMNLLLADIDFQKKVGKIWEVLESGLEFAELLDTNKKHSDGTPVKQIKWQKEVLEKIKIEDPEPTLF